MLEFGLQWAQAPYRAVGKAYDVCSGSGLASPGQQTLSTRNPKHHVAKRVGSGEYALGIVLQSGFADCCLLIALQFPPSSGSKKGAMQNHNPPCGTSIVAGRG